MAVFISHAKYARFTEGLPFFSRFSDLGHDAVMVFFVLSGFVIAYVAQCKEHTAADYAASRLARLYSVAVPALVLTVVLDAIGMGISPSTYPAESVPTNYPLLRFIANLFFVNELWLFSVRPFSNGPYWSLGYEFWYYVIFAAAFYFRGAARYLLVLAASVIAGPKILLLLPIWLLGVFVYRVHRSISEGMGSWMVAASIAVYLLYRAMNVQDQALGWLEAKLGAAFVDQLKFSKFVLSDYIVGAIVAVNVAGTAAIAHRLKPLLWAAPAIRYAAGFTFALYLFHLPILGVFAAATVDVFDPNVRRFIVVFGTLAVVWGMGTITEAKKGALKWWFLNRWPLLRLARLQALHP